MPPKDKGFIMLLVTFADWRPALLLDFSVRIMSILPFLIRLDGFVDGAFMGLRLDLDPLFGLFGEYSKLVAIFCLLFSK